MIFKRGRSLLPAIVSLVFATLAVGVTGARAVPLKLVQDSHMGWEVNETKDKEVGATQAEKNLCTVASKDVCDPGKESGQPGGLSFPESVAVAPDGNIYVVDRGNRRIQELTATGAFVAMFGWDVNESKDTTLGATQDEKNVCTALSGNACGAGVAGMAPGQFDDVQDVAVTPSGNVYVAELIFGYSGGGGLIGRRVQEFTSEGEFILEIGREVNETKDKEPAATPAARNLCTHGEKCGPPVPVLGGTVSPTEEPGAFAFHQGGGNLLATGGPEDLLYVGDEHRVQEFDAATGVWIRDLSLKTIAVLPFSTVRALTVDPEGNLYVAYGVVDESGQVPEEDDMIHEFNLSGNEVNRFTLKPRVSGGIVFILGTAADTFGHLAVAAEEQTATGRSVFGSLLVANTGHVITRFTDVSVEALVFSGKEELKGLKEEVERLYTVSGQEIVLYRAVPVAELMATSGICSVGGEVETSATFNCALEGKVNPENVENTSVWFESGVTCALGESTHPQSVPTGELPAGVSAPISGIAPNESLCYRLAGYDKNVEPPEEPLTSEMTTFTTPTVPPRIVGQPSVSFVKASSVVMSGELNPENAATTYEFQYGPCEDLDSCSARESTLTLSSAAYGKIGTTLEAQGLQPDTLYHYRLVATSAGGTTTSEANNTQVGPGTFTTAPAPQVEARTGSATAVTTTSAQVYGFLDPDGEPATYTFELGVYQGAATQYGTVLSGPTGASATEEGLLLTGLQPGTTYAYRIAIKSGYGVAVGAASTFTTAPSPVAILSPAIVEQLPVPPVKFPKASKPVKKKTKRPAQKKAKKKQAVRKTSQSGRRAGKK
jgi:NHL repeat